MHSCFVFCEIRNRIKCNEKYPPNQTSTSIQYATLQWYRYYILPCWHSNCKVGHHTIMTFFVDIIIQFDSFWKARLSFWTKCGLLCCVIISALFAVLLKAAALRQSTIITRNHINDSLVVTPPYYSNRVSDNCKWDNNWKRCFEAESDYGHDMLKVPSSTV